MICTCCGIDKELTSENFYVVNPYKRKHTKVSGEIVEYNIKGGFRRDCIQCCKDKINKRYATDEAFRTRKKEYEKTARIEFKKYCGGLGNG